VTDKPKLTPANEDPWYVLMTLHGEQDGKWVDDDLHDQNRAVWNAWSCQQLDDGAAAELAKQTGVDVAETRGWSLIATEVKRKHRAEMKKRNDDDFTYPGFPDFQSAIQCLEIQFCNILVLKGCIFTQDANFIFATFTQDANFFSATFTQDADFPSATFTQTADFSSATFDGPAKFVAARFGVRDATETCVPIFTDAAFARLVSFRDADFVTHYPVLEGTEFRETVVVTAKSTHWPKAGQPLLDDVAKGAGGVPTKEVAKDSCARLRHALGKQGMPEEEHFFYRREMKLAGAIAPWNRGFPIVSLAGRRITVIRSRDPRTHFLPYGFGSFWFIQRAEGLVCSRRLAIPLPICSNSLAFSAYILTMGSSAIGPRGCRALAPPKPSSPSSSCSSSALVCARGSDCASRTVHLRTPSVTGW
jgi:hypothetical protein